MNKWKFSIIWVDNKIDNKNISMGLNNSIDSMAKLQIDDKSFKFKFKTSIKEHGYAYLQIPLPIYDDLIKLKESLKEFRKLPLEEKKKIKIYTAEGEENTAKATNSLYHEKRVENHPDFIEKLSFFETQIDEIEPLAELLKPYINFLNQTSPLIFNAFVCDIESCINPSVNYLNPTYIRCLLYPEIKDDNKQVNRMGAHTDIGLFTYILTFDCENGFTSLHAKINGEFQPVKSIDGYCLIIAGEFMHYLSPEIKPLVHKVLTPSPGQGSDRITIVNFVSSNDNLRVKIKPNRPFEYVRQTLKDDNVTYSEFMEAYLAISNGKY